MEITPFKVRTMNEVLEEADGDFREWQKTRRIGCAEYVPENNTILLHLNLPFRDAYEIDIDRCQNAKQFTDWVWQLHGKTWFTGEISKDFLDCLFYAIKERYHKSPQNFFGSISST